MLIQCYCRLPNVKLGSRLKKLRKLLILQRILSKQPWWVLFLSCYPLMRFYAASIHRFHTQRKVLDSFDKIKSAVRTRKEGISVGEEIQPLKIHLAYAAGRESALKPLHKVLSVAIDKVQDREDFRKFSQFIEGLVAYHKFHGGKEERR